ncbi:type III secretion system cytoplasmic ring protein SctQ [Erwinia tracheiphila]|uniref:Type III secretion system protein n=1 Tax=Erwinia tracheiphila TaxID=65700 RepID=A0A0M2KAX1_9GAMM|nr:type III secretion system cytoplasmic ring protein SctQ [Erwinia tracheiphila]AXF77216.1 YscQ/HrcQ family type III secretion apparatus protein [Erwinia tracheiphila]EOS94891.1 type III secretion system protein [Erwinia tracheiphila PSU-1]KKF36084.1 type III secretion system protein [Erwinia tracheiphila]UIA84091.1 type III secretion system cytoplasmic ring protein SctQ [Erwinia tracheiphila]UIA87405.1 type III secretion system cytoplasmic ring protein SctQ [Erwinia tracheiphila]
MNNHSPLHFPRFSRAAARSQNQLARGYYFPFSLGEEAGTLYLLPGGESRPQALSHWQGALGYFALDEGMPLLNMLSLSPLALPENVSEEDDWQWALFNQYFSGELAQLFGPLKPSEPQEQGQLCLRLHVRVGERHAECPLYLSHERLSHWLNQPGWQCSQGALPKGLVYTQPLVLGRLTLSTLQLQALNTGDVVVPPVKYFTPDGQGSLILAGQQLHGELQLPHHFLLNHLESTALNPHAADEFYDDEHAQEYAEEEHGEETYANDAPSPQLTSLPLSLEVRCGRTRVTLGELQQLRAGSVLTLENVTPGEAGLYHGETLIARGELVDVEGHLGLQLTQLLLNAQQEAG